jgi:ribosomal-protein-alanine N-acetyltransferase
VAADNQPALALYRRFGFVETGRRPAYYENVDAVLMQRDLSNQL